MSTITATPAPEPAATPGPGPPVAEGRRGFGADLWRAVTHNRKAMAGVALLVFFLVLAIFPGQIAPHDHNGYARRAQVFLGTGKNQPEFIDVDGPRCNV